MPPRRPGRVRRWAGTRVAQLLAAGLVGLIIGGLAVGTFDALTGGGDAHDHFAGARFHRGPWAFVRPGGPGGPMRFCLHQGVRAQPNPGEGDRLPFTLCHKAPGTPSPTTQPATPASPTP